MSRVHEAYKYKVLGYAALCLEGAIMKPWVAGSTPTNTAAYIYFTVVQIGENALLRMYISCLSAQRSGSAK